jgi:hypothetical protein
LSVVVLGPETGRGHPSPTVRAWGIFILLFCCAQIYTRYLPPPFTRYRGIPNWRGTAYVYVNCTRMHRPGPPAPRHGFLVNTHLVSARRRGPVQLAQVVPAGGHGGRSPIGIARPPAPSVRRRQTPDRPPAEAEQRRKSTGGVAPVGRRGDHSPHPSPRRAGAPSLSPRTGRRCGRQWPVRTAARSAGGHAHGAR